MTRNFTAELQAARAAEDWAAHERIWEERRFAEVEQDDRAASVTFDSLRTAVDQMEIRRGTGSLADRLDDVLDRARVNADDTCYVEKSVPVEEYSRIALDSVACILSERETDAEVVAWFTAQGVRY